MLDWRSSSSSLECCYASRRRQVDRVIGARGSASVSVGVIGLSLVFGRCRRMDCRFVGRRFRRMDGYVVGRRPPVDCRLGGIVVLPAIVVVRKVESSAVAVFVEMLSRHWSS